MVCHSGDIQPRDGIEGIFRPLPHGIFYTYVV